MPSVAETAVAWEVLAVLVAVGAAYVEALGGAFETNKMLMGLVGVPIVIPSVFGILWKRPNTKGVYICIAVGVLSGLFLKLFGKGISWEAGTFIQIGVSLAGYALGALFGTGEKERRNRDELFAQLEGGTSC